MNLPTQQRGHGANLRGQRDALANLDRDNGPWHPHSPSQEERALYVAYQVGYGYGMQQALQRDFGDLPC